MMSPRPGMIKEQKGQWTGAKVLQTRVVLDGGRVSCLLREIKKEKSNIFSLALKIKEFKAGIILVRTYPTG